jgi:penicillin-binding protein 1A
MAALTNTRRKRNTPWSRLGIAAALLGGGLLLGAVLLGLQWYSWSALARNLDYSKLSEMESASLILDRNGELLGRIFLQNRNQKPLAEISPLLQKALISSEDARFYDHSGVDPIGIASTLFRSIKAFKLTGGASTLSQQLARNTFPQDLPQKDKSLRRKIQEMFVAKEVEKHLTKAQILEYYLNRVYFGSGFYGAEAASQGYFGKKCLELNAAESALLIGLLPLPEYRSPHVDLNKCVEARNRVLARMRELSYLTESEYQAALSEKPKLKSRFNRQESYATNLVSTFMRNLVGGEESMSGGYRIFTTIDQALQRKAEQALLAHLQRIEQKPEYPKQRQTYAQFSEIYREYKAAQAAGAEKTAPKPEYLQGTVVLLDNASGAIRAIVGGRDPLHSEFNRAVDGAVPPGSAFLPLVFATAFEKGLHPGTIVQDAPMDNRLVMVGGTSGILGEWSREEAQTPYEGPVTARTALIKSKNAASVRLGTLILGDTKPSLEAVAAFARAAGIESPMRAFPASFLGSSELKPLELALAYSCFPGGGTRPAATLLVDRVEDRQGKVVFQSAPGRVPVCSAGPAYQVHECLAANLTEGPAA